MTTALQPLTHALLRRLARPQDSRYQRFVEFRTVGVNGKPAKQPRYGLLHASSGNFRYDNANEYGYITDENGHQETSDDEMGRGGMGDGNTFEGRAHADAQFFITGRRWEYLLDVVDGRATLDGRPVVFRDLTAQRTLSQSPTKGYVTRMAGQWANWPTAHKIVQAGRRGTRLEHVYPENVKAGKEVEWALARYMRDFAPRAPEKPLHAKTRNGREVRYLYRGIAVKPDMLAALQQEGKLTDAGYMAFSTDRQVAVDHAEQSRRYIEGTPEEVKNASGKSSWKYHMAERVVMRLAVDSVPRGTPWAWFRRKRAASFYRTVPIKSTAFGEVVLPPGTLRVLSFSRRSVFNDFVFDVTYVAARKGANSSHPTNAKKGRARATPRKRHFENLGL